MVAAFLSLHNGCILRVLSKKLCCSSACQNSINSPVLNEIISKFFQSALIAHTNQCCENSYRVFFRNDKKRIILPVLVILTKSWMLKEKKRRDDQLSNRTTIYSNNLFHFRENPAILTTKISVNLYPIPKIGKIP
jgi:hypothetical protein